MLRVVTFWQIQTGNDHQIMSASVNSECLLYLSPSLSCRLFLSLCCFMFILSMQFWALKDDHRGRWSNKIWRTVSTDCRQKDKYKDEAKLKWNAAIMSAKQLQILDWLLFKQFGSVASSTCAPDPKRQVLGLLYNFEPWTLPFGSCDAQLSWKKPSHNLFRSL